MLEDARLSNPDLILPRISLVASYAERNRTEEARRVGDEIRSVNPNLTVAQALDLLPGGLSLDARERSFTAQARVASSAGRRSPKMRKASG